MKSFIISAITITIGAILFSPLLTNATISSQALNPTCVDNYTDWPNSLEYNPNHPWNLRFFPGRFSEPGRNEPLPTMRQFIDLNGDGRQDFLYMSKDRMIQAEEGSYHLTEECVLLGTGHGLATEYQCVIESRGENRGPRFYGDCALIE